MPHPPSAAKRHRQSLRRQERNRTRRTAARSAVRRVREAIEAGNQDEAQTAVRAAAAVLDRAAAKRVIHPNNAARRKSRLMRQVNALQDGAAPAAAKRSPRSSTKTAAKKTAARSTRTKKS